MGIRKPSAGDRFVFSLYYSIIDAIVSKLLIHGRFRGQKCLKRFEHELLDNIYFSLPAILKYTGEAAKSTIVT